MEPGEIPAGFILHNGGPCPVDPESYVEPLIWTSEGWGSGGVCKASMHEAGWAQPRNAFGAVGYYRPTERGTAPALDPRDRL